MFRFEMLVETSPVYLHCERQLFIGEPGLLSGVVSLQYSPAWPQLVFEAAFLARVCCYHRLSFTGITYQVPSTWYLVFIRPPRLVCFIFELMDAMRCCTMPYTGRCAGDPENGPGERQSQARHGIAHHDRIYAE